MNELEKFISDSSKLESVALQILEEAKRNGADQAEVSVAANKGFSVSAHEGEVETIEFNQDKAIEVHVYFGKRTGTSSISDISEKAIKDAVTAACHIAKFTDIDRFSGIAEVDELAFDYPKLELAFSWPISIDDAIKTACLCEREAIGQDKRIIRAEEVTVATADVMHILANSHGFVGVYPYSRHEISCILVAKEKDEMQRDYSYSLAADPTLLKPISEIAKEAAEKTVRRLGARRIKTTRAPVLFIPEVARSLLGHFIGAITGRNIYRKSTFLHDQLHKQVFPSFVTLQEFPYLEKSLGSAPFDNDGVKTRENIFIKDGILNSYCLGVYSARQLGLKTTGNSGGIHNLTISPGELDFNGLIKSMGKGLVVTELLGQGVNIINGDYSRGISGFWVEGGKIQFPVHEVTVAGNLKDMYKNIAAIGNDVDVRGNIRTGSILISEMMIAGE